MEYLIGKKFGRLIVLDCYIKNNMKYCLCRCDCGKQKEVRLDNLKRGATKSCGCLARETLIKKKTTHGDSKTRIYKIWDGIKKRCRPNSKNKYYHQRGIQLCHEWLNFNNFKNWSDNHGYNDNLTIDRIDVNGNYCPENCRWVNCKQQNRNKRNNHILEYNNNDLCLSEISEKTGIKYQTLVSRVKRNSKNMYSEQNLSAKYIEINNEKKTISEWLKFLKIPRSTAYSHIKRNGEKIEDFIINYFNACH